MLLDKITNTIKKYNLLSSLDKVLAAVSGGPDSLALLFLLNELKVKLGIKIVVAHLNHGLRGKSSDLDEKFVKNISQKLNLEFVSKKINWPRPKVKHTGEQALRKLRYDFLFETARQYNIGNIALAHTLDDQAETVLMRLIRGTGLYGLISILPKRKINKFFIIRPMIEISRREIIDYLGKIKIKPRIDKTNFDKNYLRNKIRHGLLKELGQINPNIKQILGQFSQQAAIDYDYLYQKAKSFVKQVRNKEGEIPQVKINLEKINSLHIALQRMVVRVALETMAGDLRTFDNRHWEEIQSLIKFRPQGAIIHLTRNILIKKYGRYLIISSR